MLVYRINYKYNYKMAPSRYYNIGGKVINVTGRDLDCLDKVIGLDVFETVPNQNAYNITIEDKMDFFYGNCEIDSFEVCDTICKIYKIHELTYAMIIINPLMTTDTISVVCDIENNCATIGGNTNPMLLRVALWAAYGLIVLSKQNITINSSVVSHNNRAVMFVGEQGSGKTTHSKLWSELMGSVKLLNDDSPILSIEEGVGYVYGSPWSGSTHCFKRDKVKLAGIVKITQAPHNKITKLKTLDAIEAILPYCPPMFVKDTDLYNLVSSIISKIFGKVSVYHLECLPNLDAARLSFVTVLSNYES